MMEQCLIYVALFGLAMVTVHFVAWIGSVLHNAPDGGGAEYAVYTFRGDQNQPMTTNILMNILFPNVMLILMYMVSNRYHILAQQEVLFYYVCFYYIYRIILICLILKRRELLSIPYELMNSIAGIALAYFLVNKFLIHPDRVFISPTELVNEFWLVMIVLVYKFVTLLFNQVFQQKTFVNERKLTQYIQNKFAYFYQKYKASIGITKEDNKLWILLFSIMIFENYNRGSWIRTFERIKVRLGFRATVGIMQVGSARNLSDEESIALAYDRLKNEIVKGNIENDEEWQIEGYAAQYNPDEDYAKSIAFVYEHISDYIRKVPELERDFYLATENDEQEAESEPENMVAANDSIAYLTLGDIMMMSGLSKKQVKERLKSQEIVALYEESTVQKAFEKEFREQRDNH